MDVQWVKIRSWHIYRTYTRMFGSALTVCGRAVAAPDVVNDRPGNERTCETCLRIAGPR